jgi:uncharacterized membrane protein
MKQTKSSADILIMVQLALLSAVIVVLATVPYVGYIKIPVLAVQATTIHIPVIVGSILLGWKAGAFLGGVFGLTSLIINTMEPGITSFCFSPFVELGDGMGGNPLALVVCFVPRILCGIVPYWVYQGLMKLFRNPDKFRKLSVLLAGIAGSMTNTILVMSMIYLFFGAQYAAARGLAFEAVLGVVLSVVGINGTIEAIIAALIASAVVLAMRRATFLKRRV